MSYEDTKVQLGEIMAPLNEWGNNTHVDEIAVNRPNEVFARERGKWTHHEIDMDFDDCYDIAILAAALRKQTVGDHNPIVGADIPFGTGTQRLHAILPDVTPSGTVSLTIRRAETTVSPVSTILGRYDTNRWNQWMRRNEARQQDFAEALAAYDSGDIERFLTVCVIKRLNIYFTGATGAGKSTLAKSTLQIADPDERIITVENDARELILRQLNVVRLVYSSGDLSGNGVTSAKLLMAALRMRPDRIIMGELKDPEAAYTYVNEGLTGHPGSITTGHGSSAPEGYQRLFSMVKGSTEGRAYNDETIHDLLENAVDVIIPLENFGAKYAIREVFFSAEARRRGETLRQLRGN